MVRRLQTIADAAGLLEAGGVLLLPTDTLPGLHARIDRPEAVRRVAALKGRPGDKPLVVLAASAEAAFGLALPLDARQAAFARQCWPGPFSLVLPAGPSMAREVTGGGGTVAVRVPDRPALAALLAAAGGALVSTSANRAGEAPAADLAEAERRFGCLVDGSFDPGDPAPAAGAASAVIDLASWPPRILRAGPVAPPAAGGAALDRPTGGV